MCFIIKSKYIIIYLIAHNKSQFVEKNYTKEYNGG